MVHNYWQRRQISRRSALRGAGVGIAGLAGAALVGCGGGDEAAPTTNANTGSTAGSSAAVAPTAGGGKAAKDQVRLKPGLYTEFAAPSAGERDPLANGRYGGTLLARYLDPPH